MGCRAAQDATRYKLVFFPLSDMQPRTPPCASAKTTPLHRQTFFNLADVRSRLQTRCVALGDGRSWMKGEVASLAPRGGKKKQRRPVCKAVKLARSPLVAYSLGESVSQQCQCYISPSDVCSVILRTGYRGPDLGERRFSSLPWLPISRNLQAPSTLGTMNPLSQTNSNHQALVQVHRLDGSPYNSSTRHTKPYATPRRAIWSSARFRVLN